MEITDLRIGDQVKVGGHVHRVLGLHIGGDVKVDAVEASGSAQHYQAMEVELCQPRYKLPAWRQVHKNSVGTYITIGLLSVRYEIAEFDCGYQTFFFAALTWEAPCWKKIGKYPTIEDAKEAAERDFNELITSMTRYIKQLEK